MNNARMLFASGFIVLCVVGCSDSANTAKSKVSVKLAEQDFLSIKRQAEAGNASAQYALGLRYSEGKSVAKDLAQAVTWWRKAAEQGNVDAQFNLGGAYYKGEGVLKDTTQGMEWWQKAAEQGDVSAQYILGVMYDEGDGVPKDDVQAVAWYRKAADQGHAEAQFSLGVMYDNGVGVPKDAAQAVTWWRKAADQGDVGAQNNLGRAYIMGEGVPKDAAQAVAWWRKAAEPRGEWKDLGNPGEKFADQGDANAQLYLGWAYDNGKGVPKDAAQAVAWYRKAAEQRNADAQNALGVAYDHGEGVPRDALRAYMWFNLAAAQGNEQADKNREIVALRMSAGQIAEAQRLTREWKPGQHTESPSSTGGTSGGAMEKAMTGTAFVVSSQGHLLTNRHVVGNCQQVRLAGDDKPLKVLPQDEANDLALLQMTGKPKAVAVFRAANDLRQGESIAAYGYPLLGALAAGGNLSPGVVSALAGLGNNTSQIQITAPVQQGNSGGPVLDGKGQVVGVVVQKLDAVKVAKLTGDVPQNVNFAINESTARAFLDSNQVGYKTGNWWNVWQKDLADIAEDARDYTVVLECWK
jgi:uncharacterized protein